MRWEKIIGLCVLSGAISVSVTQQFMVSAKAAVPLVRATYQGTGAGLNNNVAVIWLLGSDGSLKICTHAATSTNPDAPTCSAQTMP
jgi:hypothetical protein